MGKILKISFCKKTLSIFIFTLFFVNTFVFAQSSQSNVSNLNANSNSQVSELQSQQNQSENQNQVSESQISLNSANQNLSESSESDIQLNFNNQNQNQIRTSSGVWIFIRMILVLALIIFLIWFIFKMIKKSASGKSDEDPFLRKVASITLSPGKSVQIVTLIDKAFVLGVSDNSVNLISDINDVQLINALNLYADKTQNSQKPKNFGEMLGLFMGKKSEQTNQKSQSKKSSASFSDFMKFFKGENSKKNMLDEETSALINSLKNQRLNTEDSESDASESSEKSEET